MSDTVKRWWALRPYLHHIPTGNEHERCVVPASAYDAVVAEMDHARGIAQACEARAEKAEADLGSLAERIAFMRDRWTPYCARPCSLCVYEDGVLTSTCQPCAQYALLKKMKNAERDKLAATVERVRALRDKCVANGWGEVAKSLDRALAEPVEATFPRCRECGKWKQP